MFGLAVGDGGGARPVLRAASFASAVRCSSTNVPKAPVPATTPPASFLAVAPFIPSSREAVAEFGLIRIWNTSARSMT
jgi:hypothetical protein